MRYHSMIIVSRYLNLIALVCSGFSVQADSRTVGDVPPPNHAPFAYLRAAGGRVDACISELPLAQVLRALAAKIGITVTLNDPTTAERPVSIELRSASIPEALVAILDGYSYTVSPAADTWTVTILSTMPRARSVRPPCAHAELRHVVAVNGSVIAKPDFLTAVGTADVDEPLVEIPTSLDEFEPLNVEDDLADVDSEDDAGQDLTARSEKEQRSSERQQRYHDAVLNRALNALRSPNQNLRLEALNALGGLEDDRVADVLVEAANDRSNGSATLRAEAVSALYRNTAELGFANGRAVDTLKQLAKDADDRIRGIAQSALRDMARYERENAAQ